MGEDKKIKNLKLEISSYKSGIDPEGNSKAILVKHIPFGFFERELLGYFTQFGAVRRVRVARNKKTGNHKGWAFVLFTDAEVAQLAAEAMHGYLMFEKRLECKVIKNKDFPPFLCKGPRIISPPLKHGTRKRHAKQLNKIQSGWGEDAAKKRLLKNIKIRGNKFAELGYQLPAVVGLSEAKELVPVIRNQESPIKAEEIKSDNTENQVKSKLSKKRKTLVTKNKTDMVKSQRRRCKME